MNNKNHGNEADCGKGALSYLDFTFVAHSMKMWNDLDSTFKDKWFADSGATMHMSNNKNVFFNLDTSHRQDVSVGTGQATTSPGRATVFAQVTVKSKKKKVAFNDTLYVPDLMCNLLSISQSFTKSRLSYSIR